MAEENQAQQVTTKEPQQVTKKPQGKAMQVQRVSTKDPKKVEAGKRLTAISHNKREVKKREEQVQLERTTRRGFASGVNQYYGIRAVIALGVIGGLGYYIYQSKKGGQGEEQPSSNPQRNDPPQTNKFEMD